MAVRSRHVVEREIMPSISAAGAGVQDAVRTALVKALYGDDNADVKKRQALLLGQPEIEYLAALARTVAAAGSAKEAEATIAAAIGKGDGKRNLAVMKQGAALGAGLEAALFGRMVTSDTKANTDAAIHVAHAFTVHAEEIESDYFTVVDDLVKVEEGEAGTAGIFETELTSGLFYGYVVIDVGALLDNVGGDTQLAARIVRHLLHMIATVTPGAKKGSTAPYAYADMMLLELGDAQPRSLAGAFRNPVPRDGDVLAGALKGAEWPIIGIRYRLRRDRTSCSVVHCRWQHPWSGRANRPRCARRLGRTAVRGRGKMIRCLLLVLEGPMLSFGVEMVDARGPVGDFPAASLLTGMLGNALGWRRSDSDRLGALQQRLRFAARIDREA
jgi:CRISPR-associated protein Cas7/Cse4/CasC subtype I-E